MTSLASAEKEIRKNILISKILLNKIKNNILFFPLYSVKKWFWLRVFVVEEKAQTPSKSIVIFAMFLVANLLKWATYDYIILCGYIFGLCMQNMKGVYKQKHFVHKIKQQWLVLYIKICE